MSKAVATALNQVREAKNSTSRDKQQAFNVNDVFTQGPQGEQKYAEYIFNYELPRIAMIADSLEKQAALGASNTDYLRIMAHVMREKIASEAARLIKEAGCGCGCNDCGGSDDLADKLLDYSVKVSGVKKKYQSDDGGLNRKGRAHFKRTEGANLKRPVSKKQAKKSPKSAKRRKSFCARMGGMKKKHNINCSKTPDKSICKALRKWDC